MISDDKLSQIAEKLGLNMEQVQENRRAIEELDAVYFWSSEKGGISMIVDINGKYLAATSSVNYEELLEKFKNGERNGKLDD